jgi:Bacterial membrane protein YfhO
MSPASTASQVDAALEPAHQPAPAGSQPQSRPDLNLADGKWRLPDRRDLLILAVLCLLPAISFSALLFFKQVLYRVDISWIHYPLSILKAQLLRSGQLFLWNPHIQFGFPQLADQDVLALYPLNLFFLLPVKPTLALSLFAVAHFTLAGVFSYVLARSLRIGRGGALVTALTFAFGGYLMAQLTNLNVVTGSVWLPLIFWLFMKALHRKSLLFAGLCGAAIALQIVAGHPQVVFYTAVTLAGYGAFWLVRLWRSNEVGRGGTTISLLSLMAVAVVAGLLLAAVQILPTWELTGLSPRATGMVYDTMTTFSLAPNNLLTFLFPNHLGNPVLGYTGDWTFEELHAYVGILPLLLIPWAWTKKRRDGHLTFFAFLAGVALLLTLGGYTPLYRLLIHVPGFDFFRVPARWLFIVSFALSVLAGYGFDALAESGDSATSRRFTIFWKILFGLNVALMLILAVLLIGGQQATQTLDHLLQRVLSREALLWTLVSVQGLSRLPLIRLSPSLDATLSSLNPSLLFMLLSSSGFLLIYLWNKRRIGSAAFQTLAVGLIGLDLFLTGGTTINPVRSASYFEMPIESRTFLQQNAGLYRIAPLADGDQVVHLMNDMPTAYGLYSSGGHVSALVLQRYNTLTLAPHKPAALWNLMGVKYLIVDKGQACPGYVQVFDGKQLEICENESVLPRAYIVHHAEVLPSGQAALERLLADDFDPGRTVILEEDPPAAIDQAGPPASDLNGAEIVVYSPHRVVVNAHLAAAGFLVLSDTYYPGWEALVDGRETKIYQADYLFRAVALEQGDHVVEYRYRPRSFRVGLTISLITAAALCVGGSILFLVRRRGRRTNGGRPYAF